MQRMIVFVCLAAVLVLSVAVGGCGRQARTTVPIVGIPPQGEYPTLVEVENFSGSVRVIVDPTQEAGVVARVRRVGPDAPRRRRDLAKLVEVEAHSSVKDGARLLHIVTMPAEGAKDVVVDLTIRIARSGGTAVRNSGGRVELMRVSGPVHVENGIGGEPAGDIVVRTGRAMTGPAHLQTTTGSILYQIGPGSAGRFDLKSENGRAEFASRLGRVEQVTSSADWYRGILNNGTNDVVLRGEGRVRVAVMSNAEAYRPN